MAIKGKKKSQKRGSQAKRRPASAPRQAPVARRVPWYRSQAFRVLALLTLLIVGSIIIVLVKNAQDAKDELAAKQDKLDAYTTQVKALVLDVQGPATEMATIQPAGITPEQVDKLTKSSDNWTKVLGTAQGKLVEFPQAAGTTEATALFGQSLQLYVTAAKTYQLALELSGDQQVQAIQTAGEIKAQAGTLWTQATTSLDAALAKQELEPSGIPPPDAPTSTTPGAGQPLPTDIPTDLVPPGGGGGGGKAGGGKAGGDSGDEGKTGKGSGGGKS
jgi:hypothetical protein